MPRQKHNTTALPRQLREELGLPDGPSATKRGRGARSGNMDRKEKRKAGRSAPQSIRGRGIDAGAGWKRPERREDVRKPSGKRALQLPEDEDEEGEDETDGMDVDLNEDDDDDDINLDEDSESEDDDTSTNHIPHAVRAKLADDDAEIARLERRLRIKNKGDKGKGKLPKAFRDDGLDELLGDLGEDSGGESSGKRKRTSEEDEWLRHKRRKAEGLNEEEDDSEEEGSDDEGASDFSGVSDDEQPKSGRAKPQPKPRENPYVAPVAPSGPVPDSSSTTSKYIPPSRRAALAASNPQDESLIQLRRQAQGPLNKLSAATLVPTVSALARLYDTHPRAAVTGTLADLILALVYTPAPLLDSFVVLHAGLVAGVGRALGSGGSGGGSAFVAEFVARLVERFEADYGVQMEAERLASMAKLNGAGTNEGGTAGESAVSTSEARELAGGEVGSTRRRAMANAVSLLAHLYSLHAVGCGLVFDYVRLFLREINELNTELLLKIIKISGPQLRTDDPTALKDIVLLLRPAVAAIPPAALSVRTRFMVDTITDLKNNRIKSGGVAGAAASSIASEHVTRIRKALGSMAGAGGEPLRVGRDDLLNADKRGKWWVIGASWQGRDADIAESGGVTNQNGAPGSDAFVSDSLADDNTGTTLDSAPDLLALARAHRMNTAIRRAIFIALLSASDCRDARLRLAALRLKRRTADAEIPRVLLHLAAAEEAYNPYYTLVAKQVVVEDRRAKMGMGIALWDFFRRMGETGDFEDEEDEEEEEEEEDGAAGLGGRSVSVKAAVNLAKMFARLLVDGTMTIGVLKVLNLAYLQPKTRAFVEVLLVTVLLDTHRRATTKGDKSKGNGNSKTKSKTTTSTTTTKDTDNAAERERAIATLFSRAREAPRLIPSLIVFLRRTVGPSSAELTASSADAKAVRWGVDVAVDVLQMVKRGEAEGYDDGGGAEGWIDQGEEEAREGRKGR